MHVGDPRANVNQVLKEMRKTYEIEMIREICNWFNFNFHCLLLKIM